MFRCLEKSTAQGASMCSTFFNLRPCSFPWVASSKFSNKLSPHPFLKPSRHFSSKLSSFSFSPSSPFSLSSSSSFSSEEKFSPSFLHPTIFRSFQSYHCNEIGFQKKYKIDDSFIWLNRSYEDVYKHELVNKEVTSTWTGSVLVNDVKLTSAPKVPHFYVSFPDQNSSKTLSGHHQTVPLSTFNRLKDAVTSQLCGSHLFVFDGVVGTNPRHQQKIRIISQAAWQYHFFKNLYLQIQDLPPITPDPEVLKKAYHKVKQIELYDPRTYDPATFEPDITVFYSTYSDFPTWLAPEFGEKNFIAINQEEKIILASGLCRPYEVKLAIASLFSYWLPQAGTLPLNCTSIVHKKGNIPYVIFGIPEYDKNITNDYSISLIGDDYHGWADEGLFAYERGAYRIISEIVPETDSITTNAIQKNTLLENIRLTSENRIYWNAPGLQTNGWASFPLEYLQHGSHYGLAEHPRVIVFGIYDSLGVLPLVSRLTPEQAIYFFLSGYIGRIDNGNPIPEFYPCYTRGDLALSPYRYASLLEQKLSTHGAFIYLVNVGWNCGSPSVGQRVDPQVFRTALRGLWSIDPEASCRTLPYFDLQVPEVVNGVEEKYQRPDKYWIDNRTYDERLRELATSFLKFWASSKLLNQPDQQQQQVKLTKEQKSKEKDQQTKNKKESSRDWSQFGPKL